MLKVPNLVLDCLIYKRQKVTSNDALKWPFAK